MRDNSTDFWVVTVSFCLMDLISQSREKLCVLIVYIYILNKSRDLVVQALLVDPVVTVAKRIPDLVDNMIAEQSPWLDYLK